LLTEEDKTEGGEFDDNLSASDRVVAMDQSSNGDQSFLSIRQYESSDYGGSSINNDLDSNYSMTDIKKGSGSEWDDN
jgi:hypothetical protein